ncbi:MAG: hypothetical protein DRO67_00615 [Candidatus Asgardarchaeum californiense]|nr:MAG: hypothetical protein DRO67_00615 [Candidatus Asgardarchaeum californiense]
MSNRRDIVNFFELTPEWQKEAISNLDEYAEEATYIEPLPSQNPQEHILFDLNEAMTLKKQIAYITISNNSALKLYFNTDYSEVVLKFI